jgi:YYY domain-containing protein
MQNVLLWLVAVELVGLAAFPMCSYLFPRLRDRGYSVSKAVGLLLIGYLSWILSVLHVLPSVQLTIAGLLVVMGGLSGWYMWRRRLMFLDLLRRERTAFLVGEVLFLLVFIGWVVFRAYDPSIDHTEQPMDIAFLNASIRSELGAPEDPWLRGASISYYYFGYWMMGVLSELTRIPSYISYNLSMALIPAMAAMGIFGLVYNLVRADSRRLRYAVVGGVAAAFLLTAVANLEGVLEFMRVNGMGTVRFWEWVRIDGLEGPATVLTESWRPQEHWWWWHATRVIGTFEGDLVVDYTIQEFPFFSFMLGDLHPHVMSVPFVILFLTVCWSFLLTPFHGLWGWHVRTYVTILAMGLSLGGLAFTNMWDLPVFGALFLGIVALKTYTGRPGGGWGLLKHALPFGAAVIGVALLLFLPYYLTFTSQVSGIAPVAVTTRPLHLLIVWALFLVAVTPFILGVFWRTTVNEGWARLMLIGLLVGFLPFGVWAFLNMEGGGASGELFGRLFQVLPFALLISIAVYSALWLAKEEESSAGKVFALVLSALGLLLIMGPELLYVDDGFGGASERMNTVFKLYYQGWIVLAAASGFALYYWGSLREYVSGWKLQLTRLWSAVFVVLLVGAAYYPLAAAATKGNLFHEGATLDGLAYTGWAGSAEYRAIKFIREDAGSDSAVLEAVGRDYSSFGRISASTGVPTVLGWPGHESQWRGSSEPFEGRPEDVATIYRTQDVEEARNLLAKYRVDYVYVGRRELGEYGSDGLSKFASFMDVVFDEGDVVVYRTAR